jgi:hypothetical protein
VRLERDWSTVPSVGYAVEATMCIGSITLRSFAKHTVITGINHTETVSNPTTDDMNICLGLDDKTFSLPRRRHPEDDEIDST